MSDWVTVFERQDVLRVRAKCGHPHFYVQVLLLGDPQAYRDGVRSESLTFLRCSNARGFLAFLSQFTADRASDAYRPSGEWMETVGPLEGTSSTQVLQYAELVEADPEGDVLITFTGRVTEKDGPVNDVLVEHTTRFKAFRADLLLIANALDAQLRACCARELAAVPPRGPRGIPA